MASDFEALVNSERARRDTVATEQQRKQAAYDLIKKGLIDEVIRMAGGFRDTMVRHGIRPQPLHVEVPSRRDRGPWVTVDTGHRGWRPLIPGVEYGPADEARHVIGAGLFVTTDGHVIPVKSASPPVEAAMKAPAVVYDYFGTALEIAGSGRHRLRPLTDIQREYLDGCLFPQPVQPGVEVAEGVECYPRSTDWGDVRAQLVGSAATWLAQSGE